MCASPHFLGIILLGKGKILVFLFPQGLTPGDDPGFDPRRRPKLHKSPKSCVSGVFFFGVPPLCLHAEALQHLVKDFGVISKRSAFFMQERCFVKKTDCQGALPILIDGADNEYRRSTSWFLMISHIIIRVQIHFWYPNKLAQDSWLVLNWFVCLIARMDLF